MSRTLDVAEATVQGHVSKLLYKLGVEDRTQAVLAAMKKGSSTSSRLFGGRR
ncbi:MAG: response regulator transcription factor [Opitutaceae bacterium]|nr:response regulator transcription factor [Opitutaceae bacterium]